MTAPVRLLILGTGGMARNHAEHFAAIPGVQLVAGIDTRPQQLATFQATHGIAHGIASVSEALAWGEYDAVTNDTTFEAAAQGGTVRLEAFTGTPGPDGVVIPEDEGYVGATVDAFWSTTERLRISVTAACLDTTSFVEVTP